MFTTKYRVFTNIILCNSVSNRSSVTWVYKTSEQRWIHLQNQAVTTGQVRTYRVAAGLGTHGGFHAPAFRYRMMQSSYKQQLGPSRVILVQVSEKYYRVSAKDCTGNCSVCSQSFLSALINLFHGAVKIVPKDLTMQNHPKSLLMLSVTNHLFNSCTIQ